MQNDELTDEEFAAKWPENAEHARYSVLVEIYRVARDRAMAEREKAKEQPQQDAGEFWESLAGWYIHGPYVWYENQDGAIYLAESIAAARDICVEDGPLIGKAKDKAEAQALVEQDIARREVAELSEKIGELDEKHGNLVDEVISLTSQLARKDQALDARLEALEAKASAHPTPYVERLDRMVCAIVSSGCFLESPEEEITQLAAVFLAENDTFIELT